MSLSNGKIFSFLSPHRSLIVGLTSDEGAEDPHFFPTPPSSRADLVIVPPPKRPPLIDHFAPSSTIDPTRAHAPTLDEGVEAFDEGAGPVRPCASGMRQHETIDNVIRLTTPWPAPQR